ncbi:hypothetical protein GCM10008955_12090 [Deinococcus malanensis]|uniref:DegV family protein n=1 Tax=Deinococcus malanensis TaxID=1706855 RepID=A0ABQ2ESI7_9DEIO|nr:DegV family protein [Deinococcus malanensis]GGK20257.1 hypothetical protein GCM10008955_12090 [Deinococcus malanensis]
MIAVLTDSTSDLSPEAAQTYGIEVIPLTVQIGGRSFLDWQEIDPDAVYDHLRSGGQATTEPPSADFFEQHYRGLLETHEAVFSVHISGELSETVRHAREAVSRLPEPTRVRVVDSLLTTAPLAEVALAARAALDAGQSMEQAEQLVHAIRTEMSTDFSVASLEYLRRSGRIGRAQQVVGNMLNLRPVLHFDQGKLSVVKRLKAPQVLPDMLANAVQRFGNRPVSVTIVHAGRDVARISELQGAVSRSGLNIKQGRALLLGPVIGAHVGPGTFGVLVRPYHG